MAKRTIDNVNADRTRYFMWKRGYEGDFTGDAEACVLRREALESELGRAPQARDILADAQSMASPFRADVYAETRDEAAEQRRLEICRKILRCLVVVDIIQEDASGPSREIERPAVIHVPGHGYQDTVRVLNDEDMYRQAVAEIVRDIEALQRKVAQLAMLKPIYQGLEVLKKLIAKGVKRKSPPPSKRPRPRA